MNEIKLIKKIIYNKFGVKCHDIQPTKNGMTNDSYICTVEGVKYIVRINGLGSNALIDRHGEAEVLEIINRINPRISDELIEINNIKGYKISKFIENAHVCDVNNSDDIRRCITKLRDFHELKLQCSRDFNIESKISFYQNLWINNKSIYEDYEKVKKDVLSLMNYVNKHVHQQVLSHIDSISDNFLLTQDSVYIIDFEYASMCDPHIDIAMFALYSYFTKEQLDNIIDIYFNNNCPPEYRIKIYCYMALGGLLWSNWCEYKSQLGVIYGKYEKWQYDAAKKYAKIAKKLIRDDV